MTSTTTTTILIPTPNTATVIQTMAAVIPTMKTINFDHFQEIWVLRTTLLCASRKFYNKHDNISLTEVSRDLKIS